MSEFMQQLVNGLTVGMGYAVVAVGLTIIFGLLKVMNFAHGEFFTLGAYAVFWSITYLGISYWAALPLATVLVAGFSVIVYSALIAPLQRKRQAGGDQVASLLVTYGLSLVIVNSLQAIAGPNSQSISTGLVKPVVVGSIVVPIQQVIIMIAGVTIFALLTWLLKSTIFGKRLRAVSQNELGAALVGVPVRRVKLISFILGTGLAGIGGMLVGPSILITPSSGQDVLFTSFIIVILGGLGSVPGAAVAGLLLGIVEALGTAYVSSAWTDAYGFALLLLVLIFRPTGLGGLRKNLSGSHGGERRPFWRGAKA